MQPQPKRKPDQPVLDQQAFQQLLSAAYVMQEHNARLKKAPGVAKTSPGAVLSFPEFQASVAAPIQPKNDTPPTDQAKTARGAMQKNWTSLWEMHHSTEPAEAIETAHDARDGATADLEDTDLFPTELKEIVEKYGEDESAREQVEQKEAAKNAPHRILEETALVTTQPKAIVPAAEVPIDVTPLSPWVSARRARAWLESLRSEKANKDWLTQQWKESRGNFYIVAAAVVLLVVIVQWLVTPPPQPTGGSRQLSVVEQLLVSMGIAEAPPVPQEYHGNPNTKVWVDVHTGLYYCPGADLYGKSKDGKITLQLDAQRDQFQPSTLKPCD